VIAAQRSHLFRAWSLRLQTGGLRGTRLWAEAAATARLAPLTDHAPLEVCQVISAHANPESENHARGNPFYGFTTWLYNVGDPSAQALVAWQISIARA
jgi:hypothetical protein